MAMQLGGLFGPTVLRIGLTGLARSGKTALLTSIAANLLAAGRLVPSLPALSARLGGRRLQVALAPSGASDMPRFDYATHLAALASDPSRWPDRTDAASLLALDLRIARGGMLSGLPPHQIRLELLDYPGEWLLDLPLLKQDFAGFSAQALRRMQPFGTAAGEFLAFVNALTPSAPADEFLAATAHRLYVAALEQLRAQHGLSQLQPGRFLMPPPGALPPWMIFSPLPAAVLRSRLGALLEDRFDAYCRAVKSDLVSPAFGQLDALIVLADLLSALHDGAGAYADAASALEAAASALRFGTQLPEWLRFLDRIGLPPALRPGGIRRIAFVASKADHVAERQRGNLARLMAALTGIAPGRNSLATAIAAVRCTEDFVWTLDGHPVSAVRGRVMGETQLTRSYPGEVPDTPPDAGFWAHPFLRLPAFEPMRLPEQGKGGVPQSGLDTLLTFLLEDVL